MARKMRICKTCRKTRPHRGLGLCPPCYSKQYYGKYSETIRISRKKHYDENPEKYNAVSKRCRIKRIHGLTVKQTSIIRDQPCEHCKELKPIQLDHNHATGLFRAGLCRRCNIMVGYYESTPELFTDVPDWVASREGVIHPIFSETMAT